MNGKVLFHSESTEKGRDRRNAIGAFLALSVAALAIFQGGFGGMVPCLLGAIAWIVAGFSSINRTVRKHGIGLVPLLFFALAAAYFLSAVVNGLTLTTLSEAGVWFGVAAVSFISNGQSAQHREKTLTWLIWVGIASAVLGVVLYSQVVPVESFVDQGRLQFFFQYANAAGAWFAAFATMCALSTDARAKSFLPLPLIALLLTQSLGAVLAFTMGFFAIGMKWWRDEQRSKLLGVLLQGLMAVIIFCGMVLTQGAISMLFGILAISLCLLWDRAEQKLSAQLDSSKSIAALLAACAAVAISVAVVLRGRIEGAAATFVERAYHVADGISLWLTSPVVGVGPDNWQYLYPYVQTAQYHASVIHNSYVQVLVDTGILGFGLLLAIVVAGIRFLKLQKGSAEGTYYATFVIALHSLVDLDLQFAAVAFLFAFCVSDPRGPRTPVKRVVAGSIGCTVGIGLCILGFLAQVSLLSINFANTLHDYSEVRVLYEGNSLAKNDISAQTGYVRALYESGEYDRIEIFYDSNGSASDEQAIYIAVALYQMGDRDAAGLALVEELERQPYNDEFYLSAKAVIDVYGLDANLRDRYNAAVERANELAVKTPAILAPRYLETFI